MKEKPINPYARLLRAAKQWSFKARFPKQKFLWSYSAEEIKSRSYAIDRALVDRVETANMLGWDVKLQVNTDKSMSVVFVERTPEPPEEFKV